MNKSDEILERCFKCKSYQEDDCGIYFMVALWQKECKFFRSMKTKYQQYLEKCGMVDEDSFNKVIDSFPEFNMENVTIEAYYDINEICTAIIDSILSEWDYCYCDDVDFESKSFYLEDVNSLEDLEKICNYFKNSKWTIDNYSDLKKVLEEDAKVEKQDKDIRHLLEIIKFNASLEDLEKIIKEYGYKD